MSIVPSESKRFYGFDPTTLPNCAIWLDGSDSSSITLNGSNVTQWSDKSGNGRHATRTSGQNSPTYSPGTNYIQFTANSTSTIGTTSGWNYFDCAGLSALGGNQGFTLFVVIKRISNKSNSTTSASYFTGGTSTTTNQRLHLGYYYNTTAPASDRLAMRYWGNDMDNIALRFDVSEPIKILRFRHTSANVRSIAINGLIVQSEVPASGFLSTTYPNAVIGAREPFISGNTSPNNGFNGRMFEFVGYNRGLSDNECRQVESYLAWKCGILTDFTAGFGSSLSPFDPTSISSCALWLDAADMSTLFLDRAATTPITGAGDNVRRWNNKGTAGSFAQDLTGTSNIYPTYQNGGVYIFNQNSNNTNNTTRSSMQIQTNFQTTADYSIMAVIDFANIGGGAYLQTIYSNIRDGNNRRSPQMGCSESFEVNSVGTSRTVGNTTFIGSGRRIVELISTSSDFFYYNQAPTTPSFTNTTDLASRYTTDGNSLPIIGASIATQPSTYDNRLANGTYYELIVYNKVLNNGERTALHSYLAKKWRLNVIPNSFPAANPYLIVPTYFKRFHPLDIPSCSLWLDARDFDTFSFSSGTTVSEWRDKSPSGRHANIIGGTPTYISNGLNNRPTVIFNGSSYLAGTASNTGTVVTGFVVAGMGSASSNDARIVSLGQTGQADFNSALRTSFIIRNASNAQIRSYRNNASLGLISITYGQFFIASAIFDGSNNTIYRDGNAGTTVASTGSFGYTHYGIAKDPGTSTGYLNGAVSEVILYNSALSTAEVQEVEGYLAWKWGRDYLSTSNPYNITSRPIYPSSPKFLPTDFTNCVFWVDASDTSSLVLNGSGDIMSLFDKTSNGYIFGNSSFYGYDTTTRKFTNTIYSGGARVGSNSSVSIATPFCVFWVARRTEATTGGYLLDGTGATNRAIIRDSGGNYITTNLTTTVSTTTEGVFSTRFGTNPNFNVNGAFQSVSTTPTTFTATGITIGSEYTSNNSWMGNIAEIVILTNETESQRIQMEGYLAWKWGYVGLLANNHPYKDLIP